MLDRLKIREAEQERRMPAWRIRRQRKRARAVFRTLLWAVALGLCYLGPRGWQVEQIPAHYVGLVLVGFAAVEGLGINIWYGGPFDPRFDPADTEGDLPPGLL
jgi:hypothetical protein